MEQPGHQVDGWAFSGAPPSAAGTALTTLVEGSSFCVSTPSGNILPGAAMGLFVRDTRILSEWVLEAEGAGLEPLTVTSADPFGATFLTRSRPALGRSDSTLLVVRERVVGDGMRERVTVTNLGNETAGLRLELRADADFADLFEVKEGRVRRVHELSRRAAENTLELGDLSSEPSRGVRLVLVEVPGVEVPGEGSARSTVQVTPGDERSPGKVRWELAVPPRGSWTCGLVVQALVEGRALSGPEEIGEHAEETPAVRRAREWRMSAPVLESGDPSLRRTLVRSVEDVGALRIFDPDHPDRAVIAAGAPWFMALFGRDSLLTSWMVLPLDTRLAFGTLHALAEAQGAVVDPLTEEEPGRVLHEMRLGRSTSPVRGGAHVYYGSDRRDPLVRHAAGRAPALGAGLERRRDPAPARRPRPGVDPYVRRPGRRRVRRVPARHRPGSAQPGLEGLLRRRHLRRRDGWPSRRSRSPRCRGTCTPPTWPEPHFAREAGDAPLGRLWADRADAAEGRVQRTVLAARTVAGSRSAWTRTSVRSTR